MSELVEKSDVTALQSLQEEDWSAHTVDQSNLLLPRLLLMQGLSDFVSDGKAKMGDIVKSTSGEIVAAKDKAVEIFPLCAFENWVLEEKVGGKYEYRKTEAVTAENRKAPLDFMRDGTEWRRNMCLDFFVLLKSDIAKEIEARKKIEGGSYADPDDCLLPCSISFRRTSLRAGKDVATHIAKTAHFRMPPFVKSLQLTSIVEKNDKGTFGIFQVSPGNMATLEEREVCAHWFKTIKKASSVTVHEPVSDIDEGAAF